MSTLFISHSSRDREPAAELRRRLEQRGYGSVFLDFDPEVGIPAGRNWEQELYRQLRTCRAVIVLCSRHSMASQWCFAEIVHAKSLGKDVFPLRLDDCAVHSVLATRQLVELNGDREAAYGRLWRGLAAAGLDEAFPWDRARSPYPGLLSFEEDDAAIFFGRRAETRRGLETLERMRRFGGARTLLMLGASGVGKSSLLKAGLLPRLRGKQQEWLVLPPFRPGGDPWRELAVALSSAFQSVGDDRDWRRLRGELVRSALVPGRAARVLVELAIDLRQGAERPKARVLVVIDQLEELLADTGSVAGRQGFLAMLRGALEAPESPLIALCTLRSDLLGRLQHHPAGQDFDFADLPIGPLTPEGLLEVIEGPARLHDVRLEPGLAEAMAADARTDDALPLLAFTLRELYERFGGDQVLAIEEYRQGLGGLGGSVAQAAEGVLAQTPLVAGELRQLRQSFLALARLDDDGGFARQPARWSDLPAGARPRLERFASARLLAFRNDGGGRCLEVAHEALFRSWERLGRWLDRDRELLLWRRRLEQARHRWQQTGRQRRALLGGSELEEARGWVERNPGRLARQDREYLDASLYDAARRRRRRRLLVAVSFAVLALVAAVGLSLWRRAEDARGRAQDSARVALAGEWMSRDPTVAALVLLEVEQPERTPLATVKMRQALDHGLFERELVGHRKLVAHAAFATGGERIVTASFDGTARIWEIGGFGSSVELSGHRHNVVSAELSPDGERLLTRTERGTLRVFRPDGRGEPVLLGGRGQRADSARFGPRGERVLATYPNGTVRVWDAGGTAEPLTLVPRAGVVRGGARFTPRGDHLLTVATDGKVELWRAVGGEPRTLAQGPADLQFVAFSRQGDRLFALSEAGRGWIGFPHGQGKPLLAEGLDGWPLAVGFSPGGDRLASAGVDGAVRVAWLDGSGRTLELLGHEAEVTTAAFDASGERLITGSDDRTARIWELTAGDPPRVLRGHLGAVAEVAFDASGSRALTASNDGAVRVWSADRSGATTIHRGHRDAVVAASFDRRGERIVTASIDGTARVWDARGSVLPIELVGHTARLSAARFDASGERVLTASEDGTARIWRTDGTGAAIVLASSGGIVETASWSPRGEWVATAAADGVVRLWAADGSDTARRLEGHQELVTEVAFSPGGERLLSASRDRTARIWRLDGAGGSVLLEGHEGAVMAAAFSPDGGRVVTASADATARIWRAGGMLEAVLQGHLNDVVEARFGPRGERVVTASADGTARIWRADGSAPPIVLEGRGGPLTSAAWSSDGERVVTASGDGMARVWRADGVGEPMVLEHGRRVTSAAFSPDGRRVLTASEDRTARVWSIAAADLASVLVARVGTCLPADFRRGSLGESAAEARRAFSECESARHRD